MAKYNEYNNNNNNNNYSNNNAITLLTKPQQATKSILNQWPYFKKIIIELIWCKIVNSRHNKLSITHESFIFK